MAKVSSSNPFDLLGDGDIDGEIKTPKVQPKAQKVAPASSSNAAPKRQESRPNRDAPRGNRSSGPKPSNTGDFETTRAPRNNDKKKSNEKRSTPRRGREFDRHSGTGRVDSVKSAQQFEGKSTENYDEASKVESDKPAEATEEVAEAVVDPEDNVKTLDEYYSEIASQKTDSAKEVRKANEGADDAKWKDTVVLKKEEEDFFTGKSAASKARKNKEKAAKTFLEIEQKFNEPQEEPRQNRRNDRNDRRGGKSTRGNRGGNRSGNSSKNTPRPVPLDDQSAFPSLGGN